MKARLGVWIIAASLLLTLLAVPHAALAAVSVTTAQLQGNELRVSGTGAVANAGIKVDGTQLGQADNKGRFSIRKSPFSSSTCRINVSDGSTAAQITLSGCTPTGSATPTRTALPPATATPTRTAIPSGPSAPTLLAPANGAQVVEPLTLSWNAVTDPGVSAYNWELSASPTFNIIVRNHSTLAPDTDDVMTGGLPNGTYYWHVDAVNETTFVTGPWSATRSFTIIGQAPGTPGTPSFTGPANNSLFHPYETFTTTWTAVPNAASYLFELDMADANFNTTDVLHVPVDGPSYLQDFIQLQPVYFRVRGVAADGTLGLPSATLTVTISYNAPLPPAPVLLSPANGATITFPTTLTWSADPNPQSGEYDIEIATEPTFAGECDFALICFQRITDPAWTLDTLPPGRFYWHVIAEHGAASADTLAWSPWSATRSFISAPPPTAISYVQIGASIITGGNNNGLLGYVGLDNVAPAGGALVSLASSNPSVVSIPASTTVAAGQQIGPGFAVTTHVVSVSTPVTITATYKGKSVIWNMTVIPPVAAPTLLSPADNATFNKGQAITFDWSDVIGNVTYELQISTSSSFSSLTVDASLIPSQYTTSTLSNRAYFWRARAMDQFGAWGAWSTVRHVTVR